MLLYVVLAIAIVCGVTQASLDRAGAGRVEWLRESPGALGLMVVSIPLMLLSNLGLIAICIWAFFALKWVPVVGVLLCAFVVWSLGWGHFLANFRRTESWESFLPLSIPLVLLLRLATSVAVVFLAWSFYMHSNL